MTDPQHDQDDVLRHKDRTTKSSIGLQQWDNDDTAEIEGTGGSGTAERAAKISAGQKGQKKQDESEE